MDSNTTFEITGHTIYDNAFFPKRSLWKKLTDWLFDLQIQPQYRVRIHLKINKNFARIHLNDIILLNTSELCFVVVSHDYPYRLQVTCVRPINAVEYHFLREQTPKSFIIIASTFAEGSKL